MSNTKLPTPKVFRLPEEGGGFSDDILCHKAWAAHGYDTGLEPYFSADQIYAFQTEEPSFQQSDIEGARALMQMSEAEVDNELRRLGIDPELAASKPLFAGYVCRMCGAKTPHTHTPEEVVIFGNGMKRGKSAADRERQAGEAVAWFRMENGMRVYYETKAWDNLTPLFASLPAPQAVQAEEQPRFQSVSCSQCGESFGPGNSGYSHCDQHATQKDLSGQYLSGEITWWQYREKQEAARLAEDELRSAAPSPDGKAEQACRAATLSDGDRVCDCSPGECPDRKAEQAEAPFKNCDRCDTPGACREHEGRYCTSKPTASNAGERS